MNEKQRISPSVIRRLPRYYRFLSDLRRSGIVRISSAELSRRTGLTASQIRQDLNCFGGFGQQGYGYHVEDLREQIGKILGIDRSLPLIVIGIGNLGRAISCQIDFPSKGYDLVGLFDRKPSLIGQTVHGLPIRDIATLDDFCKEQRPQAAVLCIPKESAEELAYKLVKLGIRGFLNFSHYDLSLSYEGIAVENIHFGDNLMVLSYQLHNPDQT